MQKITFLAAVLFILFFTSCAQMQHDYHLARIGESNRTSTQDYHIKKVKELAPAGSEYSDSYDSQPASNTFTFGMGGFTTSY